MRFHAERRNEKKYRLAYIIPESLISLVKQNVPKNYSKF